MFNPLQEINHEESVRQVEHEAQPGTREEAYHGVARARVYLASGAHVGLGRIDLLEVRLDAIQRHNEQSIHNRHDG